MPAVWVVLVRDRNSFNTVYDSCTWQFAIDWHHISAKRITRNNLNPQFFKINYQGKLSTEVQNFISKMSYGGNSFNLSLIEGILEMKSCGEQKYKEFFPINCNHCNKLQIIVCYYCPKIKCENFRLCHECFEVARHSHRQGAIHKLSWQDFWPPALSLYWHICFISVCIIIDIWLKLLSLALST